MQLILMRHAKAVRPDEATSDEARGLTDRGRKDAAESAERLHAGGHRPVLAIVSPAERTRQTAAIAAQTFPDMQIRYDAQLYLAEATDILAIALKTGSASVLMIGHNPGLHVLAIRLLNEAHDGTRLANVLRMRFTTACFAAFTLSGTSVSAPGPAFHDAFTPRD